MPFSIELKNENGELYDVPEHTWNYRGDTYEQRGVSTKTQMYVSNIGSWRYRAITPSYWKGEKTRRASAAEALCDEYPGDDEEENEVIVTCLRWAILHPEGHWDCG